MQRYDCVTVSVRLVVLRAFVYLPSSGDEDVPERTRDAHAGSAVHIRHSSPGNRGPRGHPDELAGVHCTVVSTTLVRGIMINAHGLAEWCSRRLRFRVFALPRAAPDRDRRWIVQITQRQRFYPLVRSAPGSLVYLPRHVASRNTDYIHQGVDDLCFRFAPPQRPRKRFFLCCEGPGCFTWAWSLRETGMRICRWCRPGKMMDGSRYAQSGARCMKSSNRPPGFSTTGTPHACGNCGRASRSDAAGCSGRGRRPTCRCRCCTCCRTRGQAPAQLSPCLPTPPRPRNSG